MTRTQRNCAHRFQNKHREFSAILVVGHLNIGDDFADGGKLAHVSWSNLIQCQRNYISRTMRAWTKFCMPDEQLAVNTANRWFEGVLHIA
jgi:hypothetical protein